MDYISVKEAAAKWNITDRRIRTLCANGRIEGAVRCGNWLWSIPAETPQPTDGRKLRYIKNRNLKTGVQDYSKIDKMIHGSKKPIITNNRVSLVIQEAFAYIGIDLSQEQIGSIFQLINQNLGLETQITVLNMKSILTENPSKISEKSICNLNKRILINIDEQSGGKFKKGKEQEFQSIISQYYGSWSVLHPLARAAFIFAELIRTDAFEKANELTAFSVLQLELIKINLSPVLFGTENISELKASLASANMRGNTQKLLSVIIEGIEQ